MYEQSTGTPDSSFDYATFPSTPPPLPRSAGFELRPLSTGEVLDRTFALYRQRFWLYCGLSSIAAALGVVVQLGQMIYMSSAALTAQQGAPTQPTAASIKALLIGMAITLLASVLSFLRLQPDAGRNRLRSLLHLSGTRDLDEHRLQSRSGQVVPLRWHRLLAGMERHLDLHVAPDPRNRPNGFGGARGRSTALVGLGVILLILAFLGLIYGVIAYLRNSLAIAASVFEKLPIRKSMRRSKNLAAGMKWRLFLLLLMMWVLAMVAGGLVFPLALLAQHSHTAAKLMAEGAQLLITFASQALIGPLGAIAFCLFYFDSRVRKEGFDIEALMDRSLGSPLQVAASPAWQPQNGFAPSGFTAEQPAPPFSPSPFTGEPASPFAPSEFTSASAPFAPAGLTTAPPPRTTLRAGSDAAAEQE